MLYLRYIKQNPVKVINLKYDTNQRPEKLIGCNRRLSSNLQLKYANFA